MNLDGVAFDLFLPAVEFRFQFALRQNRAGPVHQRGKHGELAPGKTDVDSLDGDGEARGVQRHAVMARLWGSAPFLPPADGAHARGEFLQIEWLAEIVV